MKPTPALAYFLAATSTGLTSRASSEFWFSEYVRTPLPKVANTILNPYIESVRAHRRAFEARNIRDYVFVVDIAGGVKGTAEFKQRVVVVQGKPREVLGLEYGGTYDPQYAPTMDDLFARAEYNATFGDYDIPARFSIEYDDYDAVRSMDADGRTWIADDESSIQVYCFSIDPTGCRPEPMTAAQCAAVNGEPRSGTVELGCERAWAVGLMAGAQVCCQPWNAPASSEACGLAGGRLSDTCTRDEVHIPVVTRGQVCCRSFVR